ncbi:MAG: hypothetical protein JSV68_07060 [Anaerolineaceae bacterium]|nr:MAG: hypothetical protein JSV68_07060 [Anaerolineaceae bacterium]
MTDLTILDKSYGFILRHFMETGYAPHYTDLAAELAVSPEEGRQALHDLIALELPATWLHPGTDYIASFPPFSNFATQYRITVDGEHKWFGQCAFESLAVCWLFPGKIVRIDCPCLDCAEQIFVEVRDGELLDFEPTGIIGIANAGFSGPFEEWAFR